MQSVHRSAITLNEQMKSGASLGDLRKLRANLATELAIVHDRMQAGPSVERLLRQHYAAYQAALQSYSLVIDILEYHDAINRCAGPEWSVSDAEYKAMSPQEKYANYVATFKSLHRFTGCHDRYSDLTRSLDQRAKQLGMDWSSCDSECRARFAEAKLTIAQNLLMKP